MAIGYARAEFVKRSDGKTACGKSAYNSRSRIEFEGNCALEPKVYDWSSKEDPEFHDVLLPEGVDENFKIPEVLWNAVEAKEKRYNSQVGIDLVLALPDDKAISVEDRVELACEFVQVELVDKGFAAQIDVHPPERIIRFTRSADHLGISKGMRGSVVEYGPDRYVVSVEKNGRQTKLVDFNPREFSGFTMKEHNWHAHVLISPRRFKENGEEFEDRKPRELMPQVRKGKVISGPDWGKQWAVHQNEFFEERGLSLRVDSNGIVPQEHLGPVRMRARAFALIQEHGRRLELNALESEDPEKILAKISERQSVFTKDDVERFLQKHVLTESLIEVREAFWKQTGLVRLVDKETGEVLDKFTSQDVVKEERQALRLAGRLHAREAFRIRSRVMDRFSTNLNEEQKEAFKELAEGQRLGLIQGFAGTGKGYLLGALREAYIKSGVSVRAFGPDNATVDVLKENGFSRAENIYRFLFALHHGNRSLANGKEVWMLDEAGKLGNRPLLELLKEAEKRGIQVVLSGDPAQLPSVERGGLFDLFCKNYGASVLEEIQRQKTEKQREIAKNLAVGEVGSALDKLCEVRGFKWSSDKKGAVESLIQGWARDRQAFPEDRLLIVAHTNAEVRVLNEMARLVRKQKGEIEEREFACETAQGKIYLGVGDRMEFRKNDRELGVTNGLSGILMSVEKDRFVVSVEEGGKRTRLITFNPQEYHAYQLGYASTFYRSQGRTVDRAYVLHSELMNKEMFYVGLTRHVKKAQLFLSKEKIYSMSDLKRQLSRDGKKITSLEFTTQEEIHQKQLIEEKGKAIEALKNSDEVLDKVKGYGASIWEALSDKVGGIKERVQDRRSNESFYTLRVDEDEVKTRAQVVEVLEQEVRIERNEVHEERKHYSSDEDSFHGKKTENLFRICISAVSGISGLLEGRKKQLVEEYFAGADRAWSLRHEVEKEKAVALDSKVLGARFKEWQEACGKRNRAAACLRGEISGDQLNGWFGDKVAEIIQKQASRYEEVSEKYKRGQEASVEEKLKNYGEQLLYRLFPGGPSRKDRYGFRFGNKGALSVALSGKKAGQYYDFENQEGGSLLKLVEREMGLSHRDAKSWALDFIGEAPSYKPPAMFRKGAQAAQDDREWISLSPDPKVSAPPLTDIGGKTLHRYFNETARHAYRDEEGKLLFFALRLEDKKDPSKKMILPLSYGKWKDAPEEPLWHLKKLQVEKISLYNLQQLKENPLATVIVVEGEKAADAAPKKFPGKDYVFMTWPGGAGAVSKADWEPLTGRRVIVWPDNDKAGFKASEQVCDELKRVCAKEIHLVNHPRLFERLPKKWDLADKWPDGMNERKLNLYFPGEVKGSLYTAIYKKLGLEDRDVIGKSRVANILFHFEKRGGESFEEKMGAAATENEKQKVWKEYKALAFDFLGKEKELEDKLIRDPMICASGDLAKRLAYQGMLFEAKHGKAPSEEETLLMKEVISQVRDIPGREREGRGYAIDKVIEKGCENVLLGKGPGNEPQSLTKKGIDDLENRLLKQEERVESIENAIEQNRGLQKELGKGKGLEHNY